MPTWQCHYTVHLLGEHKFDNDSDIVISYAVTLDAKNVKSITFSEQEGFIHDFILEDTIDLTYSNRNDYLGIFYSRFNEIYSLDEYGITELNIGFTGITENDVKIFNVTEISGIPVSDSSHDLEVINNQIEIDFVNQYDKDVVIEYGISTYRLDRGYQRIGYNYTDSVRKLSNFHSTHKICNYSSSEYIYLLDIADDPQDPFESNSPKVLIPINSNGTSTIEFNYLALMYNTQLKGSFYLDECVLGQPINEIKPVFATFTFTTESGESYFDYLTIDPATGNNEFDFEINLNPIYAVEGYTTIDITIDFVCLGDNPRTLQYIIFNEFELTADDRILQASDKPMLNKDGSYDVDSIINTVHFMSIFSDDLSELYDVYDDSWMTIAVDGFEDYGELVTLYKDEDRLLFGNIDKNEYYFQSLEDNGRQLVDSIGLHLNAYDLELPQYIDGEINLYKGKGTYVYGEVYEDKEYSMNWTYNDYTVNLGTFDPDDYNSDNFFLTELPLTTDYMFVVGSLYMHHRINLNDENLIINGIPGAEFAVDIPNSTSRISSVNVEKIDRICKPWNWVESWQGYSLNSSDFTDLPAYNPDNIDGYPQSFTKLTEGTHYNLVCTEEGQYRIHFYDSIANIQSLLSSSIMQIDFHIAYEFTESDFVIVEQPNTYNCSLHWQFPPESGYTMWSQYKYHPDLTSTASFKASFAHVNEYAPMDDFKSSKIDTFEFFPKIFNFTIFEFTEFTDGEYEVTLNLTNGGEFGEDWSNVQPFSMTVQTSSGERMLNKYSFMSWQHSTNPEYANDPIFTFSLSKDIFEFMGVLENTEILVTYYYHNATYIYYTSRDDILYGGGYTFVIKDKNGDPIDSDYIADISTNSITFTQDINFSIGDTFTIEYEYKTKGGLLESKHVFFEIQPWEMKFYNSYYPFSGGSILAPLYYNFSSQYQYQLAMNYRLIEKGILSFDFVLANGIVDMENDEIRFELENNTPIKANDNTGMVVVYFINGEGEKEDINFTDITFDYESSEVIIKGYDDGYDLNELDDTTKIFVSILADTYNKYQYFHNLKVDLTRDKIILCNWTMAQDPDANLIANYESTHFIYDVDPFIAVSNGKVKQIYSIINSSNSLIYYVSEDLNDPVDGWSNFDTLIMKMGILNPDVLDYLNASFYYTINDVDYYLGSSKITLDMIDSETGAVYIKLPESNDFDKFKIQNDARIIFIPVFYEAEDFLGYFYEEGLPITQTVEWDSSLVVDGMLQIDLEKMVFDTNEPVYVLNHNFELLYEITDIDTRAEKYSEQGQSYSLEFNNITLLELFNDTNGNLLKMNDGDVIYLKYNAILEKSIGLAVEDMVLQRKPYIISYEGYGPEIPFAEISLLGIYNDENTYTVEEDIFDKREKLVAWESPLDLTPFASEIYNTYRQLVINVTFEDIYSNFKVIGENNEEYCYITDILLTSNDPRYQIVVDSIFLFEFDENATLYDSDIIDIFPNNHLESYYIGDFVDIYSEYLILNTSEFLPLYYNNATIDETEFFEVYDAFGNYYYMNSHLNSEILYTGVYNLTWNLDYNDYYYNVYQSPEDYDEDLQDLYEYYNPHVDKFRYLYLTWVDEDSWKEWHTLQQPNINLDTLEITFEWYNEITEEFESITYNQTLSEFIARNIAVEYLYPYNKDVQIANFTLSQDYSNAQNLDIQSIKGYFFNESGNDFDLESVNIYTQEKLIEISAPNGFNLSDFEMIIVLLNFTGGAYSDYTQFKMLDNVINNHLEIPLWTKNDSFYVDFEYHDLDYFLLMEDYAVGSEDSMFEYFEYTRNLNFARLDQFNTYIFDPSAEIQVINFENFTKVNDPATVLEFHDFDQNCEHELVLQKDDITRSGTFDSFKYGFVNPAGEITFHTVIQQATITEKYTEKDGDLKFTKPTSRFGLYSKKGILTNTTIERSTTKYTTLIQKDLDDDGILDKEVVFETIFSNIYVSTITQEFTIGYIEEGPFSQESNSTVWKREIRREEYNVYRSTYSFIFREFESGELNSTRYYSDAFPNELSEINIIEKYQKTVINDQDDEDPNNDLIIQAPELESLLEISHETDNIPAFFDQRMEIVDKEISSENILAVNKSMSLARANPYLEGLEESITLNIIEVVPPEGVIFDTNPGYNMRNMKEGSYGYFDSDEDGFFETIFVFDEDGQVIGVGFDYDGDTYFTPNKRRLLKKYVYQEGSFEDFPLLGATSENRLSLEDLQRMELFGKEEEDGYVLESTFSDSLFDLWKTQYSGGSSKLIKQVRKMTAQQFMKSLTPAKIAGDILWQVASQSIALIASIWTGAIGYLLVYSLLNALYSYLQQKKINNYIKQHTFYSAEYEGKEILSDKWWADRYYGDVMTTALFDVGAGVYTPIKIQTDKHIYEGEVLLAPKVKTSINFDFDVSFSSSATNYALQTRGYQLYSDYGDPRLNTYFFTKFGINTAYRTFGLTLPIMPSESKYAPNSIMYLESAISKATEENDDVRYDAIYPYYMYQVPMLQFGQSLGNIPMPEFYEEYPIFVSPEKYEQVQNKVHTIYKVYEADTPEIHITSEDSVHILHSDIKSIDIYLVGKSDPSSLIPECYEKVAEDLKAFTFDMMTGILTFDNEIYSDVLKPMVSELKQEYEDIEEFEVYYVLEIKVEKYHSLEDLEGLDGEEVKKIAYMQSVQEAIHEFIYQYTIAQQTQEKLCEIAYTTFITAISTAITLPVGIAAGAMRVASKGVNIGTQIVSTTGAEVSKIAFGSLVGLYVAKAIISEVCQEIFLDPWIEATVTNFVADAGLGVFWQALASGLAEGSREAGLGPIFNAFRASSTDTNLQSQQIHGQEQLDPQVAHDLAMESLRQHYEEQFSVSLKNLASSSVMLFGAAILGMFLPGIGSAIGAGLTAMVVVCQTDDNINIKKGLSRMVDVIRSRKTPFTHSMYLSSEEWEDFDRSSQEWKILNNYYQESTVNEIFSLDPHLRVNFQINPLYGIKLGKNKYLPVNSYGKPLYFMSKDTDLSNSIHRLKNDYNFYMRILISRLGERHLFIQELKSYLPVLQVMRYDFGQIVSWLDAGISPSKIISYLTDYILDEMIPRIMRMNSREENFRFLKEAYQKNPNIIDFSFIDNKISEINDPYNNLYFRVCKEIIKSYTDPRCKLNNYIRSIFGDILEISENDERPLPVTYVSKIMGMGKAYLTDLLQRKDRDLETRSEIYFGTFKKKIGPSFSKAFGDEVSNDIVYKYMKERGYRYALLYSLYEILCEEMNTVYTHEDFSELIFDSRYKVQILLRTPDPAIRDLDQMWTLEYLISQMRPRRNLGFTPDKDTLEKIQFRMKKVIREAIIAQLKGSLSPVAVNMILDSLQALSEVDGFYSFARLSELIDKHGSKLFLTSKVFGAGRNLADSVARKLLSLLMSLGVSSDHMAVQWTEHFLKTRGLEYIDFNFYLNEINLALKTSLSDKSVLSPEQVLMGKTIVWGLTCGRNWMTGEPLSYDDAWLHHIRHDSSGRTLYGGIYDTFINYAVVRGNEDNKKVEGNEQSFWEGIFISMWKNFKKGDYKSAVKHWKNPDWIYQFLRERNSRRCLDYWLSLI